MAGPGGQEVERISVKVVPDTDGFAKKVKTYLQKLESQLELKIKLALDKSSKAKVESELKKLTKDLGVKLKVNLDPGTVAKRLANLTRNRLVKVGVTLDDVKARAELAEVTRPRKTTVNVDVDKSVTRRITSVLSSITSSIGNTLQSLAGGISKTFSKVTSSVTSGISGITSGLGKLGAIAQGLQVLIIGGIIPAIAGLVVAAGGLVGALALALSPALFIGAGIAFALMADKGGKAAAKLKKDFEGVGKTAKSVITDAVQPMIRALQAQLPEINKFVASLRGPLRAGFQAAAGFVDEFSHGLQAFISGALGGLVIALRNPAMQAAVTGLEILFGRLGFAIGFLFQELAKSGVDFGNTLTAIGDSMVTLLPALGRMLGAFASVSPEIINGLTRALESVFETLSDPKALQGIADLSVDSFKGIALAVSGVVKGITLAVSAWNKLKATAESTWDNLKGSTNSVVTAIKEVWDKIWQAAKGAFDKVKKVVQEDLLPALKDFLPAVQPIVAFLIKFFGGVLVDIIKDIGTILAGALKVISGVLNIITGLLTGNWSKVWLGIKQIVSGVLSSIFAIIRLFLLSKLGALFKVFGKLLGGIWRGIWRPISDTVSSVLGRVFGFVTSKFGAIKSFIFSVGRSIGSSVSGVWNGIWSKVSSVVGRVVGRVKSAWNSLKSATSSIWHGIQSVISGVWNFIQGIIDKIAGAVNRVKGFIDFLNPFNMVGPPGDDSKKPTPPRKFDPGNPGLGPIPVKGIWDSIDDMMSLSGDINNSAKKFSNVDVSKDASSAAIPGSKVYNVTVIGTKNIPTEQTIIKGLQYLDALYSHG